MYLLKAAAVAAAIGGIAAAARRRHHPYARFGPANQVTSARALLVAAVAGLVGEPHTDRTAWVAVSVGALVVLLDGVDGWLARRTGMASPFGARFDMEIDAFLIFVLAVLTWRFGKAGGWILLAGLLRYGFVAAGRVLPWMRGPLTPTFRGKATCVVQIAGLLLALLPLVAPPLSVAIAAASLLALTWSFGIDTRRLWRQRA